MNWKIEVKPLAEKQYLRLDRKTRKRIKKALYEVEVEDEENPLFHKNVKPLTGKLKGDYRLRVGEWRLLLTPDKAMKVVCIYAILPRGSVY